MDTSFIRGVIPPIVTPVGADERLDVAALGRVIEHVIGGGVHGILVLGTTGEFFGFPEQAEQEGVLKACVERIARRVPIYFGIGAVTTRQCVGLAKMAARNGASAITILPPMFLTPNEDELFLHFKTVSEATELPLLIYNNPDRLNVNVSATLVERLATLPRVAGIKDSSGDLTLTAEFIRRTRGSKFRVMAGRDVLILATLAYGGFGCVASSANVAPKLVVEIYDKFMAGDLNGAKEAQLKLAPLRAAFNLASFPAAVKDAMNVIGLNVGKSILPNTNCTEANLAKLRKLLEEAGVFK